jgi:hypothetical protein
MASTFGINPGESHHTSYSMFGDYPAKTARLSKEERKGLKQTARKLFETSPSEAQAFLSEYRGYTNFRPNLLMGKLMTKPVDYERFRLLGETAYQDLLGRSMSDAEWQEASGLAKTMGIKDPDPFQSFINKRLASTPEGQAKIKSEADLLWESQYGTIQRDAEGNLMRGLFAYDPNTVKQLTASMLGTA